MPCCRACTDLQICFCGISLGLLLPLERVGSSPIDHVYSLGSIALLALLLRRIILGCSDTTCVAFASLRGARLCFRLQRVIKSVSSLREAVEHKHSRFGTVLRSRVAVANIRLSASNQAVMGNTRKRRPLLKQEEVLRRACTLGEAGVSATVVLPLRVVTIVTREL